MQFLRLSKKTNQKNEIPKILYSILQNFTKKLRFSVKILYFCKKTVLPLYRCAILLNNAADQSKNENENINNENQR